ncbi:peptide-methionine (S)-S-oxide reductase MsrA [Nitrososphaera viennensis]|uniref:Peptide methionine sulfoxide reductase MsrA n=2 Tax=Nitrososphaera viennensis TaxID=1034015 RepID=A0A060HLH1_9ARCH|nr:peptide-methionine (S)-S-oxide reductase MsrA [Nitrososphaera viennensis]AIC16075.1 peptide methionine sulfoxide reductase [Nitrososphaera viennensis EN76]UVS68043.1 peptide-methionine (S)-S-oxide reductase MsrA [Nitrososphaera viennensis]
MKTEIATLANGCFWCSEAIFSRLKGVKSVLPGYSGGKVENPSYDDVCTGRTGHAEAAQIEFDPVVISFEKLLDVFWHTHDPTTLNRQGNDVGTQYRSAIFYHDDKQREIAENSKRELEARGIYKDPIVTEIVPFKKFYAAEDYHKKYYEQHQNAPYCRFVIEPKVRKLLKQYGKDVRNEFS